MQEPGVHPLPAATAGHSGPDLGWDRVSVSLSLSLDPLLPTSCALPAPSSSPGLSSPFLLSLIQK